MASVPDATPTPKFHGLFRIVPALDSLRRYGLKEARADLLAGSTVAAVAVPQAMAYAMVAGVPAEYGLYTAIVMTIIGALLDSSKQLINGPTNAISIAVLSVVATISDPEERLQAIILLSFMIGAIQLGITLFRLGDLTRFISHSVIVGFTLGAGSLLVFDQMKNLLGMKAMGDVHDHFLYRFWLSMTDGGGVHFETACIGFGTIALVLVLRWLKERLRWALLPDLLIAIGVMCGLVAWLGLDARGVKVVGEIPAKLPAFQWPQFSPVHLHEMAYGALAIALLGLLEAISMAKAIAAVTRQKLDMNQQCLSEAIANLTGSFFQCIPGSGSLTRSAINQQAGSVSQWSGVVSAVGVGVIMLVFAEYARYLPRAALAGILLVASYKMVDWRALGYHFRATRFDKAIIIATAFCAIAISIEFCVLVGVLMSFMLTVPRAGRMLLTEFIVNTEGQVHERLAEDQACDRLLIFGLEGELFFGASAVLEQHLEAIEQRVTPNTRVIILRVKRLRNPDAVGLTLIENFMEHMKRRHVHVLMCGVRPHLYEVLKRTGTLERLAEQVFLKQEVRQTSTLRALEHAYTLIDNPCSRCPQRGETLQSINRYVLV